MAIPFLILFTESLDVRIEKLLAALLPRCFEFGRRDVPVRFIVCDGVVNDESLYALRVRKRHAKTHGSTVILHVQCVSAQAKSLGEMLRDGCDFVEGVREALRVGSVAVPKSRIVWRDKVETI
jgi:hypothetical protein